MFILIGCTTHDTKKLSLWGNWLLAYGALNWNILYIIFSNIKGMGHVSNIFMLFHKYLFFEVINKLKYNCSHHISEVYLRTETFCHIGFEARQEIKPYYDIVHKLYRQPYWQTWEIYFSRWSHPCDVSDKIMRTSEWMINL